MAIVSQQVGVRNGVRADHAGKTDGGSRDEDEMSPAKVTQERDALSCAKAPGHGSRK